jgi:putative hydrolase
MKIIADYHTHTIYSHGTGTIEQNIEVAMQKGLKTLGISDHSYRHFSYGVKYENIPKMREEIDRLQEKYKEIKILLGLEANILDNKGSIDVDDKLLKLVDYVMAGYHFGSIPNKKVKGILNHAFNFVGLDKITKDYNTEATINAMKNNDIFIVTHPGDKGAVYIEEVAKVAKETNTHLEINSHHGYLTKEQLILIKDTGVKFMIGSDAHRPEDVGRFDDAIKRVKETNVDLRLISNVEV